MPTRRSEDTMKQVKFVIPGEPCGKGRPRFDRRTGRTYTPDKTARYENLVSLEYQAQCKGFRFPDEAMLDMRIIAFYGIPKSKSKKVKSQMVDGCIRPTKKPDSSNVLKAIEDALNNVAYHDDAQIVDTQVRRFYGNPPRVVVTIQEVNNNAKDT